MYDIEKEIKEITDVKGFYVTHELYGHCLAEHILTDKELAEKLYQMPRPKDDSDIIMATRFFSEEAALKQIRAALETNKEKIIEWRRHLLYPYIEIQVTFDTPTGEGIVKNTDYRTKFPVHGLRIILIAGDKLGRAFYIKTAYPVRTFDDIDEIYDAMDEWQSKRS